jgi:hypothetical protein
MNEEAAHRIILALLVKLLDYQKLTEKLLRRIDELERGRKR